MIETPEIEPLPPSHVKRIFVGPDGIRAGWSIGIFVLAMSLFNLVLGFPLQYLLRPGVGLPASYARMIQVGSGEFVGFIAILLASMVMTRIERRPLISYGLEGPHRIKRFFVGVFFGFAALSVLVGALLAIGAYQFDGESAVGWEAVEFAVGWGLGFLFIGLFEEYMMRGYVQATLTRGIGFWWGAIILSLAFAGSHLANKGESPVGIFSAAAIAFIFCISLWYLKNLWWAIGFHAAWDWGQTYFWGTPDSGLPAQGHLLAVHPLGTEAADQGTVWSWRALLSGGPTGPEGSLLIVPLLMIMVLAMWLTWRKRGVGIDGATLVAAESAIVPDGPATPHEELH